MYNTNEDRVFGRGIVECAYPESEALLHHKQIHPITYCFIIINYYLMMMVVVIFMFHQCTIFIRTS